jgi:hypothetical protein
MRREKKLKENEERYIARQEKLRARRQRKSSPVGSTGHYGGDGSAVGDRRVEGLKRQAAEFQSGV